jgi:acyl-CoA synthetase (AMP-forming)/AMP-acid ligase II
VPRGVDRMSPLRFISSANLSVFFCVPSLASAISTALVPASLPGLRLSLFCGEPLPAMLASRWAAAANNSELYNLYGPTEATIAISAFRWVRGASDQSSNGIVKIGRVFSDHFAAVVSEQGCLCAPNEVGELLLAGPQVASDYLFPFGASDSFIDLPAFNEGKCYRTGDIVGRCVDGSYEFRGRRDDQVKISGYRIELGEIEFHLRAVTDCDQVAAIALTTAEGKTVVAGFVSSSVKMPSQQILKALRSRIPDFMIPASVPVVPSFPLNANGELDRRELRRRVQDPAGVIPE